MEERKPTQPQPTAPVMDIQPPRYVPPQEVGEPVEAPAPTDADTPAINESAPVETPALSAKAPAKQPSHKKSYLAVMCAVLVSGAFAVLAVMMYVSGETKETPATDSNQQVIVSQPEKATTSDIDSADKAIDDSMSALDDTTDYGDNAVSDTTLGL
jgi:cell wall-associated NlpC family hydrolase